MHADITPIQGLLERLLEADGTDLHLSVGTPPMMRVDGDLIAVDGADRLTEEHAGLLISALMDEPARRRFHEDRQLDFSFAWEDRSRFRANAFFQRDSPALALRTIPNAIPSGEALGLPQVTRQLVTKPHGLVLVTGPTGSGKSTTLASMVADIAATRPCHILTIEDPIEYQHNSNVALVNQREIGPDVPSFAQGLRAALREDPDVVLVGELRDLETIALTLTLAETGHLVFGTLHTNDAAQTVDRLIDVFPPEQQAQVRTQLSMSLLAVIAQRLIRRTDSGRIAAFEVMTASPAVTNLIREGKTRQIRNAMSTAAKDGMQLLEHSLGQLVASGTVTMESAQSVSMYPDEIANRPVVGAVAGA